MAMIARALILNANRLLQQARVAARSPEIEMLHNTFIDEISFSLSE
jgi:hypothetical protein